ncbi:DinB family protein [Sansalvadorimonas verongulae]|uniref:DinB family protein n=1 Tax=Sansalvadorimonas verongulae TaxID=2172824 RepID=UPI0012BD29C0|nr:DinB family protein [Sansalvadorimonas verongulae]MTI13728.1 DinB family protein [Sansalvadorimonas verongulae]
MSLQSAVSANCDSLLEIKSQLSGLSSSLYTRKPQYTGGSIGVHVRHIIEHYHMLFDGLPGGMICYDNRVRNSLLEQSSAAVLSALAGIVSRLQALIGEKNHSLTLKAVVSGCSDEQLSTQTTLVRELMFIHSHTLHHQAIIAMILKAESVDISDNFGVAPATLQFRKSASNDR